MKIEICYWHSLEEQLKRNLAQRSKKRGERGMHQRILLNRILGQIEQELFVALHMVMVMDGAATR